MSDLLLLFKVQARVATFLAGLTRDRLVALAEGRMTLGVVDRSPETPRATVETAEAAVEVPGPRRTPTGRTPRSAGETFDPSVTAEKLRSCATPDEGTELLAALNPKVTDLRALAKVLNIPSTGTKDVLAKKILTLTLGSRSKHAALRQG
jgi:hypothetical protein